MKTFKINKQEYPFVFGVAALQYFIDNPTDYSLITIAQKGLETGARRAKKELPNDLDVEALLDNSPELLDEVMAVEQKHGTTIMLKKIVRETVLEQKQKAITN